MSPLFKRFGAVACLGLMTACAGMQPGGGNGGYEPVAGSQPQAATTQAVEIRGNPCPSGSKIDPFPAANVAFISCATKAAKLGGDSNGLFVIKEYDLQNEREAGLYSREYNTAVRRQDSADNRAFRMGQASGRNQGALQQGRGMMTEIGRMLGSTRGAVNQMNALCRSLGMCE